MAQRGGRPANTNAPPGGNRQNEYFVPRDGIDREVITADICRYLGNDALVRPGVYESPNGQVVQGYFIMAYRNLTTAMIEDLKADSARWELERRSQSTRSSSGAGGAQYRNSETHTNRQYMGPSDNNSYGADPMRDAYDPNPRYPGTGTGVYNGAAGSFAAQQQQQQQPQYGAQSGYSPQSGYPAQQAQQFSPQSRDVPAYQGNTMAQGFDQASREPPYTDVGVHMPVRDSTGAYGANQPFPNTQQRDRTPVSSMAHQRPLYATSGAPQQASYATTSGQTQGYYPTPASANTQFGGPVQPQDPFYGRGGTQTYSTAQEQQYETTPTPRTSAPSSNTQMATSGSSSSSRRDRDSVERHATDTRHRSHRSGR